MLPYNGMQDRIGKKSGWKLIQRKNPDKPSRPYAGQVETYRTPDMDGHAVGQ
jgi:hypothetical protein